MRWRVDSGHPSTAGFRNDIVHFNSYDFLVAKEVYGDVLGGAFKRITLKKPTK